MKQLNNRKKKIRSQRKSNRIPIILMIKNNNNSWFKLMFIFTDKEELDLKINKIKELNKINFLHNQAKLSQSTRLNPHHNKDKEIFKGEHNH